MTSTQSQPLADQRFLIFVDDVYEDLELWYPKLRLIEAGARVVVAGPEAEKTYAGKHGYPCRSDAAIRDMATADFHGVVVPGGFMPDKLRRDGKVLQLVRDFAGQGKLVAAICHGGWIPIEDDRRRLVVVLAGYPEPMQALLDTNPGLTSRFGRRLDFADYTASELGRIFQTMCEQNRYVLPWPTRWKLLVGFQHLLDRRDETFGNGRLARNVFEASIRRLANRVAAIAPLTVEVLTTLMEDDIVFADVPQTIYDGFKASSRRLTVACPGCAQPVRFAPDVLCRKVSCKRCQHEFQLEWGELAAR